MKYVPSMPEIEPRPEAYHTIENIRLPSLKKVTINKFKQNQANPQPRQKVVNIEGVQRHKIRPIRSQQQPKRVKFEGLYSKKVIYYPNFTIPLNIFIF